MSGRTGVGDDGLAPPVLRVVRGDATPEEIAALVSVLGALAAPQRSRGEEAVASAWTDRRAMLRAGLHHGPGAWRSSSWPR